MTGFSLWSARAVTPDRTLERVRVRCASGAIAEIVDGVEPQASDEVWRDATLVPGLVDLQVNGALGAAYDDEDAEARRRATEFHVRAGTTSLLATLVSAPVERLCRALERLRGDADAGGAVIGIHLEGPFLAPEKSGAHTTPVLCDPTPDRIRALLGAGGPALRMVTLAPERPGALEAVVRLACEGVVVAAGHSVASFEVVTEAVERGLRFVTHVGNASDWPSRRFDPECGFRRSEPGLVGAFMIDSRLRGSVILDGLHLHPGLARALVDLRGPDAVVLVSDATPAAGLEPGRYAAGGLEVEIHDAGYATAGEGLAGSLIPLSSALRTAVLEAGVPLAQAVRMSATTPASVLGLEGRKGVLAPGADADLLLLDTDLRPAAVWRRGTRVV